MIHELLSDSSKQTKFHTLSFVMIWNPIQDPSGHPATPRRENDAGTTSVPSPSSMKPLFFVGFCGFRGDASPTPLLGKPPDGEPVGDSYDELSMLPGDVARPFPWLPCFMGIGTDLCT